MRSGGKIKRANKLRMSVKKFSMSIKVIGTVLAAFVVLSIFGGLRLCVTV